MCNSEEVRQYALECVRDALRDGLYDFEDYILNRSQISDSDEDDEPNWDNGEEDDVMGMLIGGDSSTVDSDGTLWADKIMERIVEAFDDSMEDA